MSEYVPTTGEVKLAYEYGAFERRGGYDVEEFDRWLVEVRADERAKVLAVIRQRRDDLLNCHKDDDCHVLAQGIWLAMDDVYEKFDRSSND